MKTFHCSLICILLLVKFALIAGQRQLPRTEFFIPRTQQNAKRVQQKFTQLERLKQLNNMSGMKFGNSGASGNGWNNNVGANGGRGLNSGGVNSGTRMGGVNSGTRMGGNRRQINLSNLNAEQLEVIMDQRRMQMEMGMGMGMGMSGGGMGAGNGGYTFINVEALNNAAEMGIMPSMFMGNNGARGQQGMLGNNNNNGKGGMNVGRGNGSRRNGMNLPLCQPLYECAENFIPPQCRTWRYDTVNSMMCRSCPINTCQGGAKEMFNTMYEHHPKRLLFEALTGK